MNEGTIQLHPSLEAGQNAGGVSSPVLDDWQPARPLAERSGYGTRAFLCLLAAVALGRAVQLNNGQAHPQAFTFLSLSIVAVLFTLLPRPLFPKFKPTERHVALAIAAGIAVELIQVFAKEAPDIGRSPSDRAGVYAAMALAALVVAVGVWADAKRVRLLQRLWLPALMLIFACMAVWIIIATPKLNIDVRLVQHEGIQAFVHGRDPFALSFPDIHHDETLYAPGAVKDGRVHLGFPYPPLTMLLDIPGEMLGGDYRYSNVAAMLLTALFIALARPGQIGRLAAALYLLMPRNLLIVEGGWTEPHVTLVLSAVIFCACRWRAGLPWMLGLLWVSKQYMILSIAPALLLVPRPFKLKEAARLFAVAAFAAIAISLPVILRNPDGFIRSNYLGIGNTPFRKDALSFLSIYAAQGHEPPTWIGFVMAMAATVICIRRMPKDAAGFATSLGAICVLFFAFGKVAFVNYYYFVITSFCCAIAAMSGAPKAATGAGKGRMEESAGQGRALAGGRGG